MPKNEPFRNQNMSCKEFFISEREHAMAMAQL
jgi:hypothetical protein